jgi:transposase
MPDTFKEFRRLLVAGLVSVVLGISGYLYTAQASAIDKLQDDVKQHSERLARLDTLAAEQARINEELKEIVKYLSRRPGSAP